MQYCKANKYSLFLVKYQTIDYRSINKNHKIKPCVKKVIMPFTILVLTSANWKWEIPLKTLILS